MCISCMRCVQPCPDVRSDHGPLLDGAASDRAVNADCDPFQLRRSTAKGHSCARRSSTRPAALWWVFSGQIAQPVQQRRSDALGKSEFVGKRGVRGHVLLRRFLRPQTSPCLKNSRSSWKFPNNSSGMETRSVMLSGSRRKPSLTGHIVPDSLHKAFAKRYSVKPLFLSQSFKSSFQNSPRFAEQLQLVLLLWDSLATLSNSSTSQCKYRTSLYLVPI